MPSLAVQAVTSALISMGVSATVAGIAANVIVGVAATIASQALMPKQRFNQPQADYQVVFNQAKAARRRGYGRAKLGGPRAFFDSKYGELDQITMVHNGEVDAFEAFWVGDKPVTVDGSGAVTTSPWGGGAINIQSRVGEDDSPAYEGMVDRWGSAWTEAHQLNGIATVRTRFYAVDAEDFTRLFPEGHNTSVRAVCRLSKVFDPRTGSIAWSDNPSTAIRDFLTHPDGMPGITADDINETSFAAFADVCDETVPTKGGGTENRYRCWGLYNLTDEPKETLRRLLATCDGELYEDAVGLICIRGGVYEAPTVLLTDADILGFELEEGNDAFAAFNALKVTYTEPSQDYQPTETTTWKNAADIAIRGELEEELALDMVPSPGQARRLAKIHERKSNPRWRGTVTTSLAGLNARGERLVRIAIAELEIDETFLVLSHGIRADLSGCELQVISLGPEAYDFDAEAEGAEAQEPPDDTSPDPTVEVPTGLVLTSDGTRITATVDAPSRPTLSLDAQIRVKTPVGPWRDMVSSPGEVSAVSGALTAGTYEVRARWVVGQAASAWTAILDQVL